MEVLRPYFQLLGPLHPLDACDFDALHGDRHLVHTHQLLFTRCGNLSRADGGFSHRLGKAFDRIPGFSGLLDALRYGLAALFCCDDGAACRFLRAYPELPVWS